MPSKKYQVELHDGRKFEVETDGEAPNEDDILREINQPSNLPDVGEPRFPRSYNEPSADELLGQAKETLAKPSVYSQDKPSDEVTKAAAEPDESFLKKSWNFASSPISNYITSHGQKIFDPHAAAEYYDKPSDTDTRIPFTGGATWKGLGAGLLEGAGDVLAGFTTPINLAMMASGARFPNVTKALSAPMIAEGAYHVATGKTPSEQLRGIPEMAMGALPFIGGHGALPKIAEDVSQEWIPPEYNRGPQGDIIDVRGTETNPARLLETGQKQLGIGDIGNSILDESGRPIAPIDFNRPETPYERPPGPWDVNPSENIPTSSIDDIKYDAMIRNYQLRNQGIEPTRFGVERPGEGISPEIERNIMGEHGLPVEFAPDVPPQEFPTTRPGPSSSHIYQPETNIGDREFLESQNWQPEPSVPGIQPSELADIASRVTGKNLDVMGLTGKPINTRPGGTFDVTPTQRAIGDRIQRPDLMDEFQQSQAPKESYDWPEAGGTFTKDATGSDKLSFARTETGGVKIGADVQSLGKVLGSSLYSGDIRTIATKELVQNSLDAIRHLDTEGKVDVKFDRGNNVIHVVDNGKGLTPDEIQTIFTDLGSSGKRNDQSAIGGFGLAKAAPLLGGEHVHVESIAQDPETGNLIGTRFQGTPDELLAGVNLEKFEPQAGASTGTTVKVKVPEEGSFYDASNFVKNVKKFSDISGDINLHESYLPKGMEPGFTQTTEGTPVPLKHVVTLDNPSAETKLSVPEGLKTRDSNSTKLILRNNGMYQGMKPLYLERKVPIPDAIVVDINSKVPEGHGDYPFTANREDLRGTVMKDVQNYIDENIVKPALAKEKAGIKTLYDGMTSVSVGKGKNLHFYDTGSKFTPEEFQAITNHPMVRRIGIEIQNTIQNLLPALKDERAAASLEKTGIIFDEKLRGIRIPNPGQKSAAILINPFQIMAGKAPDEAAAGVFHVILHEMAHLKAGDHDEYFTTELANLYENVGAQTSIQFQNKFKRLTTDVGGYTPEVQEVLQQYQESRGREPTQNDILTGTGVGAGTNRPTAADFPQGNRPNGERTFRMNEPSPEKVRNVQEKGYTFAGMNEDGSFNFKKGGGGGGKPPGKGPILESDVADIEPPKKTKVNEPPGVGRQVWEMARELMSVDLPFTTSAAFRQASPWIGTKNWFKAWVPSVKSYGSKAAYEAIQSRIENDPLVKPNAKGQSFLVDVMGVKLTDLKSIDSREEFFRSELAEKIPIYGRLIGGSARAYTAFLNDLRLNQSRTLIRDAQAMGIDPFKDLNFARQLGEFMNTTTGRGSLKTSIGIGGKFQRTINLEHNAKLLSDVLFSPRLIASRINMLNPQTYIMAPPMIRQQYAFAMMRSIGAWWTIAGLAKLAGAQVSMSPTSADFGKIKIGNTRLDPGAGFQQYLVLGARNVMGGNTSSTTGAWKPYGTGYKPETRGSTNQDFLANKLEPKLKLAYDLFYANPARPVYVGDRLLQMAAPMLAGDIANLVRDDPTMGVLFGIPLAATVGMGTQTYGRGSNFQDPTFLPKKYDFKFTGGPLGGR